MTVEQLAERLHGRLDGRVVVNASLAPFTTFRVGGPVDVLLEAESERDLVMLSEVADVTPLAIVGRGSNLLVSDEGFRGVAVRLGRAFRTHDETADGLRLGGSVYLPAVARLTARLGLAGFEFAAEIPATFGGAVRMNAGAHDRSMSDVLTRATVIDLSTGERKESGVDELSYAYRHSSLGPSDIVTRGEIRLDRGNPKSIAEKIAAYLGWRREHQPPGRSAGSVFKNPPGDSAGRLIDVVGAKGLSVGGASVSTVHANFIVADVTATATDVWRLIGRVRTLVRERTGVELEPEVRFLGRFPQ